uniref:G-patch domain-containing protein n=1 Tax=Timema genevievae TaxID=629358 RepID=A0A7R9PPJ0_TIMGE|nr:unnamed protein product [Timema genevievae]
MSMLQEKRRKVKWSLNPRGTAWSKERSRVSVVYDTGYIGTKVITTEVRRRLPIGLVGVEEYLRVGIPTPSDFQDTGANSNWPYLMDTRTYRKNALLPVWTTHILTTLVDNNKFGQRLLEKMGWKEGCGLGAKLQGPVEHVKVTFKNDSKGIGFKEGSEEWTEHQSNFDSLLTQLNGGRSENKGVTSLEQVSRRSRARLHYKKFTRGKDLSRASAKDLLCILGPAKAEVVEEQAGEESNKMTNNQGVITIQGGSMEDYFNKKLANKRKDSNDHLKTDNSTETWEEYSKKRKLEEIDVCDSNGDRNKTLSDEIKHKRKSRENTLICLDTKADGANNVDSHHRRKKSVEAGDVKKGSAEADEVLQSDEIEILVKEEMLPRKVKKKKHHKKIVTFVDSEEKEDKAPNCNDTSETLISKSFKEEEIQQKENNIENILEKNIETVGRGISDTEQSTLISALIKSGPRHKILIPHLVRWRLSSCTSISELLNSFSSLRIAALSLGVSRVHGLSARLSYSSLFSTYWLTQPPSPPNNAKATHIHTTEKK